MIEVFKNKNRNFFKRVLKRSYFKSLFLISSYANESYDCLLSLYFLQNNVHFNFKSEIDFVNVENKCIHLSIKNSSNLMPANFSLRYDANICFALICWFYIFFVISLSFIMVHSKFQQSIERWIIEDWSFIYQTESRSTENNLENFFLRCSNS